MIITGRAKQRLDLAAQRIGQPVEVRRIGTAQDVAEAICYLAGAGFVTGTVLECAGGANLTVGAVGG